MEPALIVWLLLAVHVAAVLVLSFGAGRLTNRFVVFGIAAIGPAITSVWAISRLWADDPITTRTVWVDQLDLVIGFRVDELSALLTLIVSGIGTLVFVYAMGYFGPSATGLAKFGATLLAFSTAMVGLVLSDTVWSLFVFWELTSITSFLLVGHKHADPATRYAARRALLITAAGGLVLLAGLLVVTSATVSGGSGDIGLRELTPVGSMAGAVGAVLILVAAATKSAQIPFHVWLPGAMAAPTPVSAYLHSATMVKAGIILLLLMQPALAETGPWTPLGLVFGLGSMLWGAIGALRHRDAKLILAWGTVSQLGLIVALLAVGPGKATFAALSILVAHAVFKAALFMVVGEVDVRTGTRDITKLSGLARSMPIAFTVAVISGASMAGVPPLLGFAAKEAAIEAGLDLEGWERVVLLGGVIIGSVFTVAYTLRFLIGTFGRSAPEAEAAAVPTPVTPTRWPITVVTVPLAAASFLGFVWLTSVSQRVAAAVTLVDEQAGTYELIRWPGLKTAFVISMGIVAAGLVVGWWLSRRTLRAPEPVGARTVDRSVDVVLALSHRIAGLVQHGSLPIYVMTMCLVGALATLPFIGAIDLDALEWWDEPMQAVLGALVLVTAVATVSVRGRLAAALALGAVGFGVAGLFVVHGAPDLALTQLLVETVIVVGFVIAFGRLGRSFPRLGQVWRPVRVVVSVLVGLGVMIGLAASASDPTGVPPLSDLATESFDTGGGNNIVNVILTDMRALDTWGEIIVLAVVAVGVISLARAGRTEDEESATLPDEGAADLLPREPSGRSDREGTRS